MIKFTKHAQEMMEQRKISSSQVRLCLKEPKITQKAKNDRQILLKDFGKNYLKVVALEEDKNWIIITVHWIDKKRVKGYN